MSELKLFSIIGKPVFHSLSPPLLNYFFKKRNINAHYIRLSEACVRDAMNTIKNMGIGGFNVTSPYKKDIIKYLDRINDDALQIEAVNTVVRDANQWIGYNTDFIGVVKALINNHVDPLNRKAVILGAGGAARAAAYGLLHSESSKVTIINRTLQKARQLSKRLGCEYAPIEKSSLVLGEADILISCVPNSDQMIDINLIPENCAILEADYKNNRFRHKVENKKVQYISGLEWLFYQALPAFSLFSGEKIIEEEQILTGKNLLKGNSPKKTNIALIGFMGSGKTSIGKVLASKMKMDFLDLDEQIEKTTKKTISCIFQDKGESSFRKIEKTLIGKLVPRCSGKVISLGGGAVLDKENQKILKKYCHIIWLWISSDTAKKRVDPDIRPLWPKNNQKEKLESLFQKRMPFYATTSDFTINSNEGNSEEISGRIINEMGKTFQY